MKFLFEIILLTFAIPANSKNILFLSELTCPSHHIYNSALAKGLSARGHNVTFLSADLDTNPPENLHYIHLEYQYESFEKQFIDLDLTNFMSMPSYRKIMYYNGFGFNLCSEIFMNQGFLEIMNYPDDFKFDLMIFDYSSAPCLLGLLKKFNYPPLIGISPFCNPPYTADIVRGDKLGLTVKPHFLLSYDKNMNIFQRLHNGFLNFFDAFYRKYFGIPKFDKEMKIFYGKDLPYAGDLEKLMQIALVNSHPSIEFAESLPPNVIEVGGLQIKEPKPLDKEIDTFLNKGKKGSVLMSLGTSFRSDTLGEDKINVIVETFRQLSDYNFIWKFETSDMIKELPPNVMIKPWLSQNDILGHKNVKAFISHSGMLSTQESTYHGVPIVGIPLFTDQFRNLKNSINAGVAVKVNFDEITIHNLKSALLEVLESPKYKRNIEIRSKLFKDQPEKPLDRAVWWCEYVMRNPKSDHLRSAEFNFGLLGSHFWDIQVIIILTIGVILWIIVRAYKTIFKTKKFEKTKKNN